MGQDHSHAAAGAHDAAAHDGVHVDEWHHHSEAEGEPQEEHAPKIDAGMLAFSFIAIVLVVAVMVLGLILYFNSYSGQLRARLTETTVLSKEYSAYKARMDAELGLNGQEGLYQWSDATAGKVQMPVSEAMRHVVDRYAAPAAR